MSAHVYIMCGEKFKEDLQNIMCICLLSAQKYSKVCSTKFPECQTDTSFQILTIGSILFHWTTKIKLAYLSSNQLFKVRSKTPKLKTSICCSFFKLRLWCLAYTKKKVSILCSTQLQSNVHCYLQGFFLLGVTCQIGTSKTKLSSYFSWTNNFPSNIDHIWDLVS